MHFCAMYLGLLLPLNLVCAFEEGSTTLSVCFFKYWSERSLSVKRPNALVCQNELLARVHMILLTMQLSYNTVSIIHRVGDLQISVEGSLTPC